MGNLVITSDFHLGISVDSKIEKNGLPTKTEEVLKNIYFIANYCHENGCKLIILGDIFHTNKPDPIFLTKFIEFLNFLKSLNVQTYIIPGNHDCNSFFDGAMDPIAMLDYKNIKVILDIEKQFINDINCIFVPYTQEYSASDAIFSIQRHITKKSSNIVFCHHTIDGAVVGAERKIMRGKDYKLNKIEKVDLVISGHVHKYQTFSNNKIPVIYCGSPIQFDVTERNDKKGFVELNKKLEYKFHELEVTKYKKVQIDFTEEISVSVLEYYAKKCHNCIAYIEIKVTNENKKILNLNDVRDIFGKYVKSISKIIINCIDFETNKTEIKKNKSVKDMMSDFLKDKLKNKKLQYALKECNKIIDMSYDNYKFEQES